MSKSSEFAKLKRMITHIHETESTDPLEIQCFLEQRSLCEIVYGHEETHEFCFVVAKELYSE